ncbi:MAG: two-component system response regulator [Desulfobacterales bacterium CG23_combo_of_CG06-09_8_20_14_all_51_8]|nr:MAG: two-component system response regulator [Desulfobacterales bacterium CG23_combo_of_CG06-09_8_20_14_all_51_8]
MTDKVLIVDDEQDFLDVLSERLKTRDMNVSTASSAKDAIKKIDAESYDAVVLDLMMPEMDGLETLKIMKEKNPDLQVILLTGHATVEKGIQAMKLGAMDLIEKPADLATIVERIKQAKTEKIILVEKKSEERIRDILTRKGW